MSPQNQLLLALKIQFLQQSINSEIIPEVNKLSIKKASQTLYVAVKIIKENKDLISYFVYNNFNNALSSSQYPNGLKYADVTSLSSKRMINLTKAITDLQLFSLNLVKYTNELCRTRFTLA